MSARIEGSSFGHITVDGHTFDYDILIGLSGDVKKRKKKLSRRAYGTSHQISLDEAEYIFEKGCRHLIFGTGVNDQVRLSPEAERFFEKKGVKCILESTPKAIALFNQAPEPKIGLFHVTC